MTAEVARGEVTGDCAFHVRSDDESEVIRIVQRHAAEKHDLSLSDADARGLLESD